MEMYIMLDTNKHKDARINIRMSESAKALLQEAAATCHKSVTEFLLEQGLRAAEHTIADKRLFLLNDKQWEEFCAILDRPSQEKPNLKRLLSTRSVFEK